MTSHGWLSIAVFVVLVGLTVRPLGGYMAWIFTGQCASNRFLGLVERAFFRLAYVDPSSEQNWFGYARALLLFNLAGVILLFGILLLQGSMPLNPQGFGAVAPLQQWAAWVFGTPLRLYFHRGHQWQRLRRFECKHAVLQPDIGIGDVVRTIPCYRSGARHCWVARRQKVSPCFGRHIAH